MKTRSSLVKSAGSMTKLLFAGLILLISLPACSNISNSTESTSTSAEAWSVQISQDGDMVSPLWNNYRLEKRPFTFQVAFPAGQKFFVNVMDNPTNYDLDPSEYCHNEVLVFCNGTGIAESLKADENIYLLVDPVGSHYWGDALLERWFAIDTDGSMLIGQRYVGWIMRFDDSNNFLLTPIEEFSGKKLYIILYMELNENGLIDDNEIEKFTVTFKG